MNTNSKLAKKDTADTLNDKHNAEIMKAGTDKEKEQAYNKLFKRHQESVFYYLYKKTQDKELAKDLTQEVFIKCHKSIHMYTPTFAFSTWLFKIAGNHLIDSFRSSKKHNTISIDKKIQSDDGEFSFDVPDKSFDLQQLYIQKETKRIVNEAINSLKKDVERDVVTKIFLEEKHYQEVADEMNLTLAAVKTIMFRTKEKIKQYLMQPGIDFNY